MQQSRQEGGKNIPMINSFLNLCRVCPVLTDDKVNSEYKRNFTWHDGYQAAKVDVIKNAPSLPHSTVEPTLPRKKKHPEFAYRTHELLFDYEDGECSDSQEIFTGSHAEQESRARVPDEEGNPGKGHEEKESDTKKSDEKQPLMTQSYPPSGGTKGNPGTPPPTGAEGVPKTTEYRSQFVAWPKRLQQEETGVSTTARKSASMDIIASQAIKKDIIDGEVSNAEGLSGRPDEPDDDDAALDAVKKGRIKKTEYKAKFRPFSAYTYVDGNWKKATRLIKDNEIPPDVDSHAWYSEVVERLKKADQYRVRSQGAVPFYGSADQTIPPEMMSHLKDRCVLSPVSLASTSRTWKDDRPAKEKTRPTPVPVHHARKEKKEYTEGAEQPKGSPKKKAVLEKTTVRPKSAEPVVPVGKGENRSPKRTRPRAPKDLPVHGHGDLSGRKKAAKQGISSPHGKGSPVESKPRPVLRPHAAGTAVVNGEDGKVWLKPAGKDEEYDKEIKKDETMVNGYPEDSEKTDRDLVNGEQEGPDSVQDSEVNSHAEPSIPAAVMKPPLRVPLTTVKSPEEVTGVRSPDPESWTVPLEIGKGLQWMDGKTPDGQTKTSVLLSKRLKESSLVGPGQNFVCDAGSASGGESVDL